MNFVNIDYRNQKGVDASVYESRRFRGITHQKVHDENANAPVNVIFDFGGGKSEKPCELPT